MRWIVAIAYVTGVASASLAGFFSPSWYLGFLPLAAGLIFAAYDLAEEDTGGDPPTAADSRA